MNQLIQLIIGLVTVAMEGGAEPYMGQLGIAYVIKRRALESSWSDACLQAAQFSCWNTASPTRKNIDNLTPKQLATAMRAVTAAYFETEPDPTRGAYFYLNKNVVIRTAGKLPNWWDIDGDPATEIKIGDHTFRARRKYV